MPRFRAPQKQYMQCDTMKFGPSLAYTIRISAVQNIHDSPIHPSQHTLPQEFQWKYFAAYGVTLFQASSSTCTTSSAEHDTLISPNGCQKSYYYHSRSGPFSRSTRFCSMCVKLDAPMIIESPCSRFIKLWCDTQRSASIMETSSHRCKRNMSSTHLSRQESGCTCQRLP